MSSGKPDSGYLPQLDSIRAFAILIVMASHWLNEKYLPVQGGFGVRCFFVLSGFLITGILLKARAATAEGKSSLYYQFRQFYIRRTLRIFPIYYLTLFVLCWAGVSGLWESLPWTLSYLTNFQMAKANWWIQPYGHLWSLAVEEQFYMVWPAIILLLPTRWLAKFFAVCILIGPLSRLWIAMKYGPDHVAAIAIPTCALDSLVLGAVAARLAFQKGGVHALANRATGTIGLVGGIGTLVCIVVSKLAGNNVLLTTLEPSLQALLFYWVIVRCAMGVNGLPGKLLDFAPFQFLGRISYGLYLYHVFCDHQLHSMLENHGIILPDVPGVRFVTSFAATLLIAVPSYYLIETPINRLKRFFPSIKQDLPKTKVDESEGYSSGRDEEEHIGELPEEAEGSSLPA